MTLNLRKPAAALTLCAILFAGWSVSGAGQSEDETAMLDKITEFTEAGPKGAQLRLADITDFEWDTVQGFPASTSLDVYKAMFGESYRLSDETTSQMTDDSVLLVFGYEGEVVEELVISPPVWVHGAKPDFLGPDATLTVISDDPGPYTALELSE
ncbi:hypothetical protein [Paracoccus alkanivorans]|uniref:Uncharacterized protein n=1 Tax=Paracoccus alkanivorans TaxID=2116655 RepID=A0A3M0MBG4_9RHOB|nr:hypothetical protein [Paracoccus alkanivorans]RMC34931.1 hypothetical protein C9E81_12645 [Paracoccus alkanivorans]